MKHFSYFILVKIRSPYNLEHTYSKATVAIIIGLAIQCEDHCNIVAIPFVKVYPAN